MRTKAKTQTSADSGRAQLTQRVQSERARHRTIRMLGTTSIGICIVALPSQTDIGVRVLCAIVLIVTMLPLQYQVDMRLGPNDTPIAHALLNSLATVLIGALIPGLWVAGVVCLGVIVTDVVKESPVYARLMAAVSTAMMAVSAIVHQIQDWWLPIAGLAVVFAVIDWSTAETRAQAKEVARRHDELVGAAGVFVWELDDDARTIKAITGNTASLVGWTAGEVIGTPWSNIVAGDVGQVARRLLAMPFGGELELSIPLIHEDGSTVAFRHRIRRSSNGGTFRGAATEVTELQKAADLIQHQADHDALTGLPNRRLIVQLLSEELQNRRTGVVALLMVDLNRFKEVNDVLGHRTGDRLLQILAARFLRVNAQVKARLGGDEFAFVVVAADETEVLEVAQEVAAVFDQPVNLNGMTLSSSGSIGVAVAPRHGTHSTDLMQCADQAMYEAKRRHEAIQVFQGTTDAQSADRLVLSAEIRRGVEGNQFRLHFQPKVNLETGMVYGAEGLARWHHPTRGVLSPFHFLELLTLTGDYHTFTKDMLAQGIAFASQCRDYLPAFEVAVNLSSASFFDHGLPKLIRTLLDLHGVDASQLVLEITESDILDDIEKALPVFEELRVLGVGLSIDDFGTGYSSLTRLRQLPVTELKIDRSFVTNLATEPEDFLIARTVVELGQVLDRRVVAEGVETEDMARILREIGCESAQGYLFAKPMPPDEMLDSLADWVGSPVVATTSEALHADR